MNYKPRFFNLPADGIWPGSDDTPPYLFSDEIAIAVDVAFATARPILVSGPPGSGKTTLAQAVAGIQSCSFLKHTLTSRSRIEDLTGDVDQLQRLHDAQAAAKKDVDLLPDWAYHKSGLFWWAFDHESARTKGGEPSAIERMGARFKPPEIPGYLTNMPNALTIPEYFKANPKALKKNPEAVILLDEIDKAEPDLPNDLLEPMDRRSFRAPDGTEIRAPDGLKMLVLITTNGERDLPPAFLRRCVSLELQEPGEVGLIRIAGYHFKEKGGTKNAIYNSVAGKYMEVSKNSRDRRPPGTSEYLDAVRACLELGVNPESEVWKQVEKATLVKPSN